MFLKFYRICFTQRPNFIGIVQIFAFECTYLTLLTPPHLVKNKQESADLHCSHSIQDYQVMLWYKQSENKLHFLGYLNMQIKYPEEALKNKTDLDGDGRNNGTLTVKNLQPNDSAVYFCAVRYTVLQITVHFNKNCPPSELH
uniref:Ig-like domain-containing protein n=1 Tax=Pygocentrus nattereri TaxID=42514 RepID=A0AAR2L706_PYGNA